jgi:hypothetical protein
MNKLVGENLLNPLNLPWSAADSSKLTFRTILATGVETVPFGSVTRHQINLGNLHWKYDVVCVLCMMTPYVIKW